MALNDTETDQQTPLGHSQLVAKSLQTAAYSLVFILSVTGNSAVLIVVKKNLNNTRKITTNILIAHMALADILATTFGIPSRVWWLWMGSRQWISEGTFGLVTCKMVGFIIETAFAVSASMITAIALERLFVVYYPTKKILTSSRAFAIGLVTWLCSVVFYSPKMHAITLQSNNDTAHCFTQFELIKPWRQIEAAVFLCLFLVTLGLYLAIILKVRCHKSLTNPQARPEARPETSPEARPQVRHFARERMNRRVLCQSLVIVFVHYFCWIPYLFVYFSCLFSQLSLSYCKDSLLTGFLIIFFGYCNASANPFLYAILSENFRSSFRLLFYRVFFCCGERVHPGSPARNPRVQLRAPAAANRRDGHNACYNACIVFPRKQTQPTRLNLEMARIK